jgi:hypothetical protein
MSDKGFEKMAEGLSNPMVFIIFCIMAGILVYVLSLPGNILNPVTNSTFTSYFARGSNVLVWNPSTSTLGLLAIVIPLALFWFLRSWSGEKEDTI